MTQLQLVPIFDGDTYDEPQDFARLFTQLQKVREIMFQGGWWSLKELSSLIQGSEASISARIRDLRKPKHGGFNVARRRRTKGTWEYRLELA